MSPQNRPVRPCNLGFHFLEFAGIEDIVIASGEQRGNLHLHFQNALLGRGITGIRLRNLMRQRHSGEETYLRLGIGARTHPNFFAVQFLQSVNKCLRIVACGILIFHSQQIRLQFCVTAEFF